MSSTEITQDFENICRCCMELASYELFKTFFEHKLLAKMLAIVTNTRVSKNDIMPKKICDACLQTLVQAYVFRNKVLKTQQSLFAICKIVDRAKKNGNVSKDHTYHHDKIDSSQQYSGHGEHIMGHIKVEKVEYQDEEYANQIAGEQMQLENAGMQIQYFKQNGDGEEPELWLQDVGEGEHLDPTQPIQYDEYGNILQTVNVLNQLPDGTTYVEGEVQGENIGYQAVEFIDGDANYLHGGATEAKQKIHICRVCEESFYTSRELNSHAELNNHAQRGCDACFEEFHTYSALIKHCMDTGHQRPSMYKCPYCFKKFDDKQILQHHVKNHLKTKNIRVTKDKKGNLGCQVCRTAFINVHELKLHYKENKESHLTCHICLEKFLNLSKLNIHLKQHEIEKPFGCEICGARFNLQNNFERHLQKHATTSTITATQSETLYRCEICSTVCTDEASMEEHQKLHEIVSETRSHHCTECGKMFTSSGFLKKHVERFHLGLDFSKGPHVSLECELCGKVLSCKSTLYSHMKNVHEKSQKSYTCDICGKILKTKTSLELHTNYHNGNCPYKCGICGKGFTNATTLKSHSLIHTNERPHECSVCHKTFKQKPHLTTHILTIHTALKMFKCDYCEKTFALKGNLSQHLKTHTGCESPFVCSVCNKAFYFASRLRKHEKIHMKQ